MPRIPSLGFRLFTPRVSLISRPILPVTSSSRISSTHNVPRAFSWRAFAYSPLRTYSSSSSPPPPSSPTSNSNQGSSGGAPGPNATLTQRLKHLIKSYGWYALGVYTVLSVADFAVAFAGINIIGAEHVSRVTDAVKSQISHLLHSVPPEPGAPELETSPPNGIGSGGRESLMAMIILAYTVHKTLFLPFRVGLTAAFTPKLVGWLTRRGWAGGEGTKRAAKEMRDRVRKGRGDD